MKKVTFILILIFSFLIGTSQSCLPEGIEFKTQAQIDSFQINNPGCTEIEGDVQFRGGDISNFYGLSLVTSIGGNLGFGGPAGNSMASLQNLEGFVGLSYIGGSLYIVN